MNMKKMIIGFLFCLVSVYLYGQDFYMYVDGKKRTFEVSTTKLLVKSKALGAESIKNEMQRTVAFSVKNGNYSPTVLKFCMYYTHITSATAHFSLKNLTRSSAQKCTMLVGLCN